MAVADNRRFHLSTIGQALGQRNYHSLRCRLYLWYRLSFELGLLWPRFMQYAGAVIGMPFSLEGFAFFSEAIFLGIYLYGWNRVPGWLHLLSGIIVAISGVLSAVFVTFANGWMNTPTGFDIVAGKFENIHPFVAMFSPAGIPEAVHMVLAAYTAAGFATAGLHGWLLLRRGRNRFDEVAIGIALLVGVVPFFYKASVETHLPAS